MTSQEILDQLSLYYTNLDKFCNSYNERFSALETRVQEGEASSCAKCDRLEHELHDLQAHFDKTTAAMTSKMDELLKRVDDVGARADGARAVECDDVGARAVECDAVTKSSMTPSDETGIRQAGPSEFLTAPLKPVACECAGLSSRLLDILQLQAENRAEFAATARPKRPRKKARCLPDDNDSDSASTSSFTTPPHRRKRPPPSSANGRFLCGFCGLTFNRFQHFCRALPSVPMFATAEENADGFHELQPHKRKLQPNFGRKPTSLLPTGFTAGLSPHSGTHRATADGFSAFLRSGVAPGVCDRLCPPDLV